LRSPWKKQTLFAIQSTEMRQVFPFFPMSIADKGKRWLNVSITGSPEVTYGRRDGQSITDGAG